MVGNGRKWRWLVAVAVVVVVLARLGAAAALALAVVAVAVSLAVVVGVGTTARRWRFLGCWLGNRVYRLHMVIWGWYIILFTEIDVLTIQNKN